MENQRRLTVKLPLRVKLFLRRFLFKNIYCVLDEDEILFRSQDSQKQNDELYMNTYQISEIVKAIETIKEQDKIVFKMHICGFSQNEIAERLSIPEPTVRKQIKLIRKELFRFPEN